MSFQDLHRNNVSRTCRQAGIARRKGPIHILQSRMRSSTVLDSRLALFPEGTDTFPAVGKREAAVVQCALNLQPCLQRRCLGLLASVRQASRVWSGVYLPTSTACLASATAGADREAILRAIFNVSSRTSSSGKTARFTTPSCAISRAVDGTPVNMSSMACSVSMETAHPRRQY
jgi:hypothetical protein